MSWLLLQNSLLVAGLTTALAVGFGLAAALWLATLEERWRNTFLALAIVALALPPFLVTNCWISLLGDNGLLRPWLPFGIYSLGGTVWILSLMLWPITLFAVLAGWRRLEAAQFDCEPALTGFALLRWLLIPVARGELALAAVVTFVVALNNFAVPAILQTKVLPDEVWIRFNTQFDALGALRLSIPLVLAPVILLAWFSRRAVPWPRIEGTVPARTFRRQLGLGWCVSAGVIASLLCALSLGLPLAQIGLERRTWTELAGAMAAATGAMWNSFWFAALAATVVMVLALAAVTGFLQRRDTARRCRNQTTDIPQPQRRDRRRGSDLAAWLCVDRVSAVEGPPSESSQDATKLGNSSAKNTARQSRNQNGEPTPESASDLQPEAPGAADCKSAALGTVRRAIKSSRPARDWMDCSAEKTRRSAFPLRLSAFSASLRFSLVWLPFFIPGVLLGIALIWVFNRPVLAAFYQSAGIVVLALLIRYFALGCTAAARAMDSVDSDLTDAAELEGATRWQMLWLVVWPQIAPQVTAAWYVVYLLCLWDVESIVIIQPPGGETLALKIFNLLHYGHAAHVNALCLVLLGLAVLPLVVWIVAKWVIGKTLNIQHSTFNTQGNSKLQPPGSRDNPSPNIQTATRGGIGIWSLALLWCLVCGAWCFCTGCSPTDSKNDTALQSKFFARAIVIGSRGVGVGEFNKPRSVTVDRQDNLYVVDMTGRVQKFSPDGRFVLSWQMPQTDLGKPKGMACDHDGNILVVEPHYSQVNHFTPQGELVAQWGERGTNSGQFGFPRAAAVNSRGEIYVCEYAAMERVQRFGIQKSEIRGQRAETKPSPLTPLPSDGRGGQQMEPPRLLGVLGQAGTGPGEFNRPEGLAVDAQDRLYVADSCNHRIQVFSADGQFLRAFGKAGSGASELSYPYDVAVDSQGNVFVCEFGNSRIQVFDAAGKSVEIIGGPGAALGQFANPWSIALDSHGNLYVADSQNHRVQRLVRQVGQVGRVRQSGPISEGHTAGSPPPV